MLAALALSLSLLGATSTSAAPLKVGLIDEAQRIAAPDRFWADMTDLNTGLVRLYANWRSIAPRRPTSPADPADPRYRWAGLDASLVRAKAWGGTVIITVAGTPRWAGLYARHALPIHIPRPSFLAAFMRAVGKRYSGTFTPEGATEPLPKVELYEIWNEPNNEHFLIGPKQSIRPRAYAAMVTASYRALHGLAIPGFRPKVIAGAVGGRIGMNHQSFFRALIRFRAHADAASIHPYGPRPSAGLAPPDDPRYFTLGNFGSFTSLVKAWLGPRAKIWITELGWQTNPPDRLSGVSPAKQAEFFKQSLALVKGRYPQVAGYVWYLLRDQTDLTGWQSGLRYKDGRKKPLYNAVRRALAP